MYKFSRQHCSVPQCGNYRTADVGMHKYPKNKKMCKLWVNALKIKKPITSGMFVCSLHFEPIDYFPTTEESNSRKLKRNAIPSKRIPVQLHDKTRTLAQHLRNKRMELKNAQSLEVEIPQHDDLRNDNLVESTDVISDASNFETVSLKQDNALLEPECLFGDKAVQTETLTGDKGIQVDTSTEDKNCQVDTLTVQPKLDFLAHLFTSNKWLYTYTGVNIKTFDTIVECCINGLHFYKKCTDSNLKIKICIVLVKLKVDLSFRCLAVMFSISDTTAKNYFYNTVELICHSIKFSVYWPSKEEILLNMPKCFSNYNDVRVVIDATEIYIQKSKCLKCRIRSYSHYKKDHTAKFLICVTPAGLISYVSQAYGGHVSDKAIFNKENIIDLLDPFTDAIMVDKGVLIEKECMENNIKLIRPPFLRKKKQFTQSEALTTAAIARARVHVERAIQRIKIFKFFKNKIEWNLVPYLDELMLIACSIVNLSPPILGDEAFVFE